MCLCSRRQNRDYSLRSFGISKKLLYVFYQGIWPVFCFMQCFVGDVALLWMTITGLLIKMAGSVIGLPPDTFEVTVEKRTRAKLKMILL